MEPLSVVEGQASESPPWKTCPKDDELDRDTAPQSFFWRPFGDLFHLISPELQRFHLGKSARNASGRGSASGDSQLCRSDKG